MQRPARGTDAQVPQETDWGRLIAVSPASSGRTLLQQAQERQACRDPLRQDGGKLPRFYGHHAKPALRPNGQVRPIFTCPGHAQSAKIAALPRLIWPQEDGICGINLCWTRGKSATGPVDHGTCLKSINVLIYIIYINRTCIAPRPVRGVRGSLLSPALAITAPQECAAPPKKYCHSSYWR